MEKFTRNSNDVWISGVCSGISNYCKIDVMLVRLLVFILLTASPVVIIFAYFLTAACSPKKPLSDKNEEENIGSINDKDE